MDNFFQFSNNGVLAHPHSVKVKEMREREMETHVYKNNDHSHFARKFKPF